MAAPTPATPTVESLTTDVSRLTDENNQIAGHLVNEIREADDLFTKLKAAQTATKSAENIRNVFGFLAGFMAVAALVFGLGWLLSPKGDTSSLKADIVRLEDDLKKAKKEAADCRNAAPAPTTTPPVAPTSTPAPAPTPVPATGTATGFPPVYVDNSCRIEQNSGQPAAVKPPANRPAPPATPQAPAPAPMPSEPQGDTVIPDGGCTYTAGDNFIMKGKETPEKPGTVLYRIHNRQILESKDPTTVEMLKRHPTFLTKKEAHDAGCLVLNTKWANDHQKAEGRQIK